LNLTQYSHKLSRIRVQTRRKANKVVADVSIVCGLAITDVTDGVADRHEESIVNEQDRPSWCPRITQRFLVVVITVQQWRNWVLGIKGARQYEQTILSSRLSMHAVLTVQWGCKQGVLSSHFSTGYAKWSWGCSAPPSTSLATALNSMRISRQFQNR